MASLNDGFNGNRLKAARLFNELTISDIANETGVSYQAISQYENNKCEPKLNIVFKLVGLLGFPREFYYQKDDDSISMGDTYFRSLSTTTKKEKASQIEKIKLLVRIYLLISEFVRFPTYAFSYDKDIIDVELLANELRQQWKIGSDPIPNVIDIMEKNGIIVSSMLMNNDIDAYSNVQVIENKQLPVVVLGSDKESAYRRQFSAAHELGHILLDNFFDLESMGKLDIRNMENTMHEFAGALLIPKELYKRDLKTKNKTNIRFYIDLKKKYRVSAAALIVRAKQLDELDINQYQYLMKQMSRQGYRICEPYDKETPIMQPRYLKHALNLLFNSGKITKQEFLSKLSLEGYPLNPGMVEELLNLDKGYFDFNSGNDVIELEISK